MHPRSSNKHHSETPKFLNPSFEERNWIRTIPDSYPDIMRAPSVVYRAKRDDPRISSNNYVAFSRPYRGKQGLLLLGLRQRPIIIDESQPDRPSVLPLRLDREILKETWIFAISIYHTEGLIQIEDCIVASNEELRSTKTFKERYSFIEKFSDHIWFPDTKFQLNWKIQIANIVPLISVKEAIKTIQGGSLCLMPNSPEFRLIKVLPVKDEIKQIESGPKDFFCEPVIGKPDVYDLVDSSGKNLGRAAIQTLTISQALQLKKSTGQPLKVLAEWNEDFESYVVTSVI